MVKTKGSKKVEYDNIKVPRQICRRIDRILEKGMYNSRSDFVKEVLRTKIYEMEKL